MGPLRREARCYAEICSDVVNKSQSIDFDGPLIPLVETFSLVDAADCTYESRHDIRSRQELRFRKYLLRPPIVE